MSPIKNYNREKILCSILGTALAAAYCIFSCMGTGFSQQIAGAASRLAANHYLNYAVFTVLWAGAYKIVSLPLDFFAGFLVEHKYGLSRQSAGTWAWENVKGVQVLMCIGTPLALAFAWCVKSFPVFWWVWCGSLFFLFSMVLSRIAPVFIFPLFYTFQPLANKGLEERLRALARERGVNVGQVLSFNLSKDTRKANAALAGMGKTRRIIISDTLLATMTPDEITAVFAHELGHHVLHHVLKGVLLGGVYIFAGFFLVSQAIGLFLAYSQSYAGVSDPAVFPVITLFFLVFGLVFTPLTNAFSRRFERSADLFAKKCLGNADALVSSLKKLGELNMADPEPHSLVAWYSYGHPPLNQRIAALGAVP